MSSRLLMASRKRHLEESHDAQPSKRTKKLATPTTKPFPFHDLPLKARKLVYQFLLINKDPISIKVDEEGHFNGGHRRQEQIFGDPDLVRLTTTTPFHISLLHVDRAINLEASRTLYKYNTFKFSGEDQWLELRHFSGRLKSVNQSELRRLRLDFPVFDRWNPHGVIESELDELAKAGFHALERFPKLASIRFRVTKDIMEIDIAGLRSMRDSLLKNNKVTVDVAKAANYHEHGWDRRPVRISLTAKAKMQTWGWHIKGEAELVDRSHRFRDENRWLKWLQENRQRGLGSGMIAEKSILAPDYYVWDGWKRWA